MEFLFNFVLLHDYCTSLSLDGFPNATNFLSFSVGLFNNKRTPEPKTKLQKRTWKKRYAKMNKRYNLQLTFFNLQNTVLYMIFSQMLKNLYSQ